MAWATKEKQLISKDDVQFTRMLPLPSTYYTGGAYWLLPQVRIDFDELLSRINTEDALDDFLAFKRSVMEAYAACQIRSERSKPVDLFYHAGPEEEKRQLSHLFNHVVLDDVVKPGFNHNETEGIAAASDVPNLNALSWEDINSYLKVKAGDVQRRDLVHQYHAYLKGLAQCDYFKCDSNLEEALAKVKAETRWTELAEDVLISGLQMHIEQFKMLEEGENKPDSKALLEQLNDEYARELAGSSSFPYEAASIRFFQDVDFSYLHREFGVQVLAAPKHMKFPWFLLVETFPPELQMSGGAKGNVSVAAAKGNLQGTMLESLVGDLGRATRLFRGAPVAATAAALAGAFLFGKVALSSKTPEG